MTIHPQRLPVITIFLWLLTSGFSMSENTGVIRIAAGQFIEGNIPRANDNRIQWATREAEPPPGCYFATWAFEARRGGRYGIYARSEPSATLHMSRYLYAIDRDEFAPARTIRKVDLKASFEQKRTVYEAEFEIGQVELRPGHHTLTVKAGREQRFWHQGRDGGHRQFIEAIELRPINPPEPLPQRQSRFQWKDGDTVVFLGDSITDGGGYLGCIAQAIYAAYPERRVNLYNAGVGAERAVDSHYRLAYDVLCLKPTWFVLAMGVNDAFFFDRSQFTKHGEYILDRVKSECGSQIVLPTPTNLEEDPYLKGALRMWEGDRVLAYNRAIELEYLPAIESLAQKYGAVRVDIYRPFKKLKETLNGKPQPCAIQDQIHPSEDLGAWTLACAYLNALGFSDADLAKAPIPLELRPMVQDAVLKPAQVAPCHAPPPPAPSLESGTYVAAASTALGTVSFFEAGSGKFARTMTVGYRPDALAVSADGSRLYVALEPASKIVPITLPSLEAQAPFDSAVKPEFALPRRVVARRDGSLLVANYYDRVTLLGANGKVIATLDGGSLLNDVAIAPDDKTVAAAYSMNKELWLYDLAGGKKLASAPGHSYLTQVRFAGHQVLACDYDDGSLLIVDGANSRPRWLPLGKHPRDIAVASSGRDAYVSVYGDNQVCAVRLDPANPTVARRFSVGAGPGALLLDEAARCLYASCVKDGAIWRIDLETGQASRWASLEGCLTLALVTRKE